MASPADYDVCRRINAAHGKTYYFATLFFPRGIRPYIHALYAFYRVPDEIVDAVGGNPEARRAALARWEEDVWHALDARGSSHPVLRCYVETMERFAIPRHLPAAFLRSMAMDLDVTRYATFEDLRRYTFGSASVVGLMMCHVMGVTDEETLAHAADLGLAMQLANFCRDVGEDWERGRLYIPLEELDAHGMAEDEIAAGRVSPAFIALMDAQINRARTYFARGDAGIPRLPPWARRPVGLASHLYSAITEKIERNGYDVFRQRAALSKREKLARTARYLMTERP